MTSMSGAVNSLIVVVANQAKNVFEVLSNTKQSLNRTIIRKRKKQDVEISKSDKMNTVNERREHSLSEMNVRQKIKAKKFSNRKVLKQTQLTKGRYTGHLELKLVPELKVQTKTQEIQAKKKH